MLTFDSALTADLNTAATKLDWIAKINAALGPTRRVRCFRDPDPKAANAYLSGVEFLNIGNTGAITGNGGNISSFGKIANAFISQPADLSTGASILRIEGNGHWVQGTLGLRAVNSDADPTNDCDFVMNSSPTGKTGFGIKAGMRSPALLPSGTGPVAPDLDSKRPAYLEIEDWRNPTTPSVIGTAVFSKRDENLTFEDPELAQDIGDVRITFLDNSIVFDGFEFGAMLMSCNPVLNETNTDVLHQVLISCKPYNTWPSYPAMDTYNQHDAFNLKSPAASGAFSAYVYQPNSIEETITLVATAPRTFSVTSSVRGALPSFTLQPDLKDANGQPVSDPGYSDPGFSVNIAPVSSTQDYKVGDTFSFDIRATYDSTKPKDITFPSPFKAKLRALDGTLIYTFEMRDGLPINSPLLPQTRLETDSLRPKFNCGMMLPWSSARTKLNSKRYKTVPKAVADSWRPTMSATGASFNGAVPMLFGRTQVNSMNHYFAAPRWGLGWGDNPQNDARDPSNNPYLFNLKTYFAAGGIGKLLARAIGWDYEPASISLHDWYTGPGGPRNDRAVLPTAMVMHHNDPNGIRLRDGALLRDTVEAWNKAYFNHAHHYITNVKDFSMMSSAEINAGKWSYSRAYYGGTDNYVPGGLKQHVAQWTISNGSSSGLKLDRNGQPIWNGWSLDNLHTYCQPGWAVLLYNSPMHLISARLRYQAHMMAQLLGVNPATTPGYLERDGAWRWMHWLVMWKIATPHRLGISREEIAMRWETDLNKIYDAYVLPATDPTNPGYNSVQSRTLRGLGQRAATSDTGGHAYKLQHNGLAFYMTQVFLMMKTTGAWDAMYNRSAKCKKTLEFTMRCYDIFTVDFILDAKGLAEGDYPKITKTVPITDPYPDDDIPTSWADWLVKFPQVGSADWMHRSDGTMIDERDVGQHNRAAWAFMRRDYFPEFPFPRLTQACAEYQRYYDERTGVVNSKTDPDSKRAADWTYKIPSFFIPQPPAA